MLEFDAGGCSNCNRYRIKKEARTWARRRNWRVFSSLQFLLLAHFLVSINYERDGGTYEGISDFKDLLVNCSSNSVYNICMSISTNDVFP